MKNKREYVNLDFVIGKSARLTRFDGITDDLLSGGAGLEGLISEKPPAFNNPMNPEADEIRKRALWNNYRALIDMSRHYYGKIYGPGINCSGPELIAGEEYTAFLNDNVSVVLQIPDTFNPDKPYLIAAPSSGSRGVYGAIGPVGEWALKKGYAVVYTDKGTGIGYHDLDTDTVCLKNGKTSKAIIAGDKSIFTSVSDDVEQRQTLIDSFKKKYPNRIAVKHTHSKINLQKNWGKYVLQSIEFAIYLINEKYGLNPKVDRNGGVNHKGNITVIACGISNGGGASLMAAEQDENNLIDAVVVSEPNITPVYNEDFAIVQGNQTPIANHSKNLVDYITLLNIYQPAASLAQKFKDAPLTFSGKLSRLQCEERALSLREKSLIHGETIEEMASHSYQIIKSYGLIDEQMLLQPSHYNFDIVQSIAYTYVSQYGRFDVLDNLCGYSFAAVDKNGKPRPLTLDELNSLYSDQSGIPPFSPIALINNLDTTGSVADRVSESPSTGRKDMNLDGALRLRRLVTGVDENNEPLSGNELENHKRVKTGIEEIKVSTNTGSRPVIIVTGRSDAILQINHTSRAYTGVKLSIGKNCSLFSYYEITNAHHLDAFNSLYSNKDHCKSPVYFAPLHYYYIQSLDLMIDCLENTVNIPESQVVRPEDPIKDLPAISSQPHETDRIIFSDGKLIIPD